MSKGRKPDKTNQRAIDVAERRKKALQMRRDGMLYNDIADALGVCPATAYNDVSAEIQNIPSEERQEMRKIKEMEYAMLKERLKADVDIGNTQAIAQYQKVLESERKMFGLDNPESVDINNIGGAMAQIIIEAVDCEKDKDNEQS